MDAPRQLGSIGVFLLQISNPCVCLTAALIAGRNEAWCPLVERNQLIFGKRNREQWRSTKQRIEVALHAVDLFGN